jgi:hypothetical protein
MPYDLAGLFFIGKDILTTSVNKVTRKILAQTGTVVGEIAESDNVEWWQHVGFASRPSKPTKGKAAAQALGINRGDYDICFASQDVRCLAIYGELDHGETCIFAAGSDGNAQGRILLKKDGSVGIYALQGNAAGGASVTIQVLPSGVINLAGPFGGISIADGKTTMLSSAGAGVQLDANGVTMIGQTITANGSVVLGDATATGVATAFSSLTRDAALAATATAIAAFLNDAAVSILSPALSKTAAGACASLAAIAVLPTNYSLAVKAA